MRVQDMVMRTASHEHIHENAHQVAIHFLEGLKL
jgi:hypothetical protein